MVIDAAKGIELQTRRLFEVCRLRDIPIITFVNKVDREGRDPFELLDEIESTLAIDASPVVWPVGMGSDFHGCYDFLGDRFLTSRMGRRGAFDEVHCCSGFADECLVHRVLKMFSASFANRRRSPRLRCGDSTSSPIATGA